MQTINEKPESYQDNLKFFDKLQQVKRIRPSILDNFYNQLDTVDYDDLEDSEWRGGYFYTGNNYGLLLSLPILRWHGKRFRNRNSVDALVFNISMLKFALPLGRSKLQKTEFRGKTSIAMKYDMMPVWDHFRKISDDILMGIMDAKLPTVDLFYFYLIRE